MSLHIPQFTYDDPITDLLLDMERLRFQEMSGVKNKAIFNQVRHIFHMLESVASNRIEGNNTTVLDYAERTKIRQDKDERTPDEALREILNVEEATRYLEENISDMEVNGFLVRELHQLVVRGLSPHREGASNPGTYRMGNVLIAKSAHTPPDYTQVPALMDELMDFIGTEDNHKYDLLKIAIAHHRFVWIHPFENGNGRVVRLLTYAMLLKYVFKSRERIINPTAVFCSDRDAYYAHLAKADTGSEEGLLAWASYMLRGLKTETQKIDRLSDNTFLTRELLLPSLDDALREKVIDPTSHLVLKTALLAPSQSIQSKDLKNLFADKTDSGRSRIIRGLKERGMLVPLEPGARIYYPNFNNNHLLRSVLATLDKLGFLPSTLGVNT